MKTRIYAVAVTPGKEIPKVERLVRAASQAQASNHVTSAMVTVDVASQDDLVRLMGAGVKVETAGDQTEGAVQQ